MLYENDNVDQAEIQQFNASAQQWWDKNGDYKPLHAINPLRVDYINSHSPVDGKQLVDIGCGGGILCEAMAQRGARVTGIDKGEATLEVAQLHQLESGLTIDYRNTTAEDLAEQESGRYDIVTCLEMLEHVPDPASVVMACANLVKPGGDVYFSTLNRHPKAYLFAIIGAEYVLNLLPKGTHQYRRFIKPSELSRDLRAAGLTLQSMTGISYNPLSKRYRLNPDDVAVNYLLHARKGTSKNVNFCASTRVVAQRRQRPQVDPQGVRA